MLDNICVLFYNYYVQFCTKIVYLGCIDMIRRFEKIGKGISIKILLAVLMICVLSVTCFAADNAVEEGADSFYPAGIFSDNMVFQQNEPIVVWGNSDDEGKYVYGIFDGEVAKSQVVDKTWKLTFVPRGTSSKKYSLKIYGSPESNHAVFENCMIGDVWLVLGGGNVEYGFMEMSNHAEYVQGMKGDEPFSAYFVDSEDYRKLAYGGNTLIGGSKKWYTANHSMINNASALGVSLGIDLVHYGGNYLSIGIISLGFTGVNLSGFMSEEQVEKYGGSGDSSIVYNNFLSRLNNYPIKGVIMYLGESQANEKGNYAETLAAFIKEFRENRNQIDKTLPFYIIELPPCFDRIQTYPYNDWTFSDFGSIRAEIGSVPMMVDNCYICATSDTWNDRTFVNNLYPNNKSAIAKRLALMIGVNEWGFAGYDAVFAPTVKKVNKIDASGKVYELTYDYVVDGLKWNGEAGNGFNAAGKDGGYIDITAEITGKNTVRITANEPIYRIVYGSDTEAVFGEDTALCNSGNGPAAAFAYTVREIPEQKSENADDGVRSYYPAGIFSDNMVLQQDEPIVIWGTSPDEDQYVYAVFDGKTQKSVVKDGAWEITFPAKAASSKSFTLELYGSEESNRTVYQNIKIGDVWLVLGQDNVEYGFSEMSNYEEIEKELSGTEFVSTYFVDSENYRKLAFGGNPLIDGSGSWYTLSDPMKNNASAIGVGLGINIAKMNGESLPVGVISMGFVGASLSGFMPAELVEKYGGTGDNSILYNNFLSHINKYPIKGVVWYQGEANASYPEGYSEALSAFIKDYRAKKNKNLPFYLVELPPCFEKPLGSPVNDWTYADVGLVRTEIGAVPMLVDNCYVCVTSDTWNDREFADNLHPDNKADVAKRLASMICVNELGHDGRESVFAPTVKQVKKLNEEGTAYELVFDYVADGLKWNGEVGKGFNAVSEKFDCVEITAEITGKNTVKITGGNVIYEILYGNESETVFGEDASLCNYANLPAAAFVYKAVKRTDKKDEEQGVKSYYPAGIFSDNMILQQDEPIVVWGTSPDEGMYVYAAFDGEVGKSVVTDGKWEIRFPAKDASPATYTLEVYGSDKSNRTVYQNVKVGDVWLVLGQSNVEYRFGNMGNYEQIASTITGEENVSVFYINTIDYLKLATFGNNLLEGNKSWYDISHPNLVNSSALGLCTGLELIRVGDNYTPIGIVSMGFAGQELACFVPEELSATFSGYGDKSLVYNNFISHINNYPIRGVIWYQGEANAAYVAEYADGLTAFIERFREVRNQQNRDFPFYIIELPPCFDKYDWYEGNDWQYMDFGAVRAVTGRVPMNVKNCYICTTSDTWSSPDYVNNLHPDNKATIAQRLSLMICSNEWNFPGYDTIFSPTVESVTQVDTEGCIYDLKYKYTVDGLKWNGEPGAGFEAITKDWDFVDITVEIIDKDTVRITGNKPIWRITYGNKTTSVFGTHVTLCNSGNIPACAFEYDIGEPNFIPEPDYGNGIKITKKAAVMFVVLVAINVVGIVAVIVKRKKKKQ